MSENERLAKAEERVKYDELRIDRLERLADEVRIQNENIAKLVAELSFTNERLAAHEKRIGEMESLPGRGVRMVIGAVAAALASAVIGGLVTILF